jgi:hypothetical protein
MAFWDKYLANPRREFQMGMWPADGLDPGKNISEEHGSDPM